MEGLKHFTAPEPDPTKAARAISEMVTTLKDAGSDQETIRAAIMALGQMASRIYHGAPQM